MKTNMKRLLLLIAAIGMVTFAFTGCETKEGLGRDVEDLGKSMQD